MIKKTSLKKRGIEGGIGILIAFCLLPLLWLVDLSLKTQKEVSAIPPVWFHKSYFGNYFNFFFKREFVRYYFNSFFLATVSTVAAIALGSLMAYAFSRSKYRFKGSGTILFGILILRMFPPFSTIIPIYLAVRALGLMDTYIALWVVYVGLTIPLVVWMMRGFFTNIPEELEDAAVIDGCSHLQMFLRIILPLSVPGLLACAIISFIWNWNEFLFALILTGSRVRTIPVLLSTFSQDHIIIWGEMATVGTLAITPVVVFGLLARKYLLKGLTFGGIKG